MLKDRGWIQDYLREGASASGSGSGSGGGGRGLSSLSC